MIFLSEIMKKTFSRKHKIKRVPKNCIFCKQKTEPDYKDTNTLGRYLSERGKIVPRSISGICQKHQKHIASSIKQARFLALMPFIVRPS